MMYKLEAKMRLMIQHALLLQLQATLMKHWQKVSNLYALEVVRKSAWNMCMHYFKAVLWSL